VPVDGPKTLIMLLTRERDTDSPRWSKKADRANKAAK